MTEITSVIYLPPYPEDLGRWKRELYKLNCCEFVGEKGRRGGRTVKTGGGKGWDIGLRVGDHWEGEKRSYGTVDERDNDEEDWKHKKQMLPSLHCTINTPQLRK